MRGILLVIIIVAFCACSKTIDNTGNCSDGIKNQGEQMIDCGGPCPAICENCGDGIRNQGETAVDCGGPCDPCYPRYTALVNNIPWNATSRNAFISGPGTLRIYGTNQQYNMTLYYSGPFTSGTVPSGNAFHAEFRDASGKLFISVPGGNIAFSTFDTLSKSVSGTFEFPVTDTTSGNSLLITGGVFNVLTY